MAKDGKGGLFQDSPAGEYKFTDPWGHPYILLLDADYDNHIENPDCKNSSPEVKKEAPATLLAGAIAYSLGPDGVEGTADDIPSWRPASPLSPAQQTRKDVVAYAVAVIMLISILVIVAQGFGLIVDVIRWLTGKPSARDENSTEPQ